MGSRPGSGDEASGFSLPSHDEHCYSVEQSAEKIAEHFAAISQEYRPLDVSNLPTRVQNKLKSPGSPPQISEYQTYLQINSTKKPKSGVRGDLPRKITQEFAPELSLPVCRIINSILSTGEWPNQWKLEHIVPIAKIPQPQSEDDLRPISLTPFLSKVTEHFIARWLMQYIDEKIDFRQYGGLKGNSVNHYLIELINFILFSQDSNEQIAVLTCIVDFKKAFNRQSHEILVTKLSDLGVPGWLLLLVIAFLKNRRMVVNFKGKVSTEKLLPGGGPQGTIIALILFLVLINDLGFDDQMNNAGEVITKVKRTNAQGKIHLKYVDDFSLAETINLKKHLVNDQSGQGHVLPASNSQVYLQLLETKRYAETNLMKLNYDKTSLMLFNPCKSIDFQPEFIIDGHQLELLTETRILGLIIRSDLKWSSKTKNIIKKAYNRLWLIKRLKNLGAKRSVLVHI